MNLIDNQLVISIVLILVLLWFLSTSIIFYNLATKYPGAIELWYKQTPTANLFRAQRFSTVMLYNTINFFKGKNRMLYMLSIFSNLALYTIFAPIIIYLIWSIIIGNL